MSGSADGAPEKGAAALPSIPQTMAERGDEQEAVTILPVRPSSMSGSRRTTRWNTITRAGGDSMALWTAPAISAGPSRS